MSVKRLVNSRTWSDKWVETLSTVEKLLWLYLLTNDQTNMLGIYEITLSRMVFETGLTKPQVTGALKRFEQDKRAYYFFEDYIFMVNHFKNQEFKDSVDKKKNNMLKSAETLYYKLPQNVLEKLDSMGFDTFERLSTPSNRVPILDSELDNDSEGEYKTPPAPIEKVIKIEYKPGVRLSEKEYTDLVSQYGQKETEWMMTKLSAYKESTGKRYKSDSGAIRNWVVEKLIKEYKTDQPPDEPKVFSMKKT
jgi:hypothetical protein